MRKTLLIGFILILSINSFSQNLVTGKITDEQTGLPVAGASITIKGEKKVSFQMQVEIFLSTYHRIKHSLFHMLVMLIKKYW